ncbi:MAG: phosphoenolpyruvate kinase [Acidobacteria bacterium]|jgi:hypothetical protein|nr:MAG: phosphoenolpyruvate kinase [Acidobacteriota bacterium]GIU82268.1 MAG: aldolase [Pyrinomonadaceae bacterium]
MLQELAEKLFKERLESQVKIPQIEKRQPVHVVYGGANLFKADTPEKLGKIALKSIETYAPNFVEFAKAMGFLHTKSLDESLIETAEDEEKIKNAGFDTWLAWSVYHRTIEKLRNEPVEDFRIDFEDGYGFRTNDEEDLHARTASEELAKNVSSGKALPFCGLRIKSFAPETFKRAVRTLEIFLQNFAEKTDSFKNFKSISENFVVTLPKITSYREVEVLAKLLEVFERESSLPIGTLKIEIMIETPQSILNEDGKIVLQDLVKAGEGRVVSAHFGAFDYTASFGISGIYQHLQHDSCNLARQLMQLALARLGIRLSDSVTIEMPIPIHKGENLSAKQIEENKLVVHQAWRKHFENVTFSLSNGFYQSWDLHPAQLVARYAALYSFFLSAKDEQAKRLKNFIEKATQASLTGNIFDDAASVIGIINFFRKAKNCGALSEEEISQATGLRFDELSSASFLKLPEN